MDEIEPKDIIAWQNELLAFRYPSGKAYSQTYLKTIHAQLSAIFNHAVRYYHLPYNPHNEQVLWVQNIIKKCCFGPGEEYRKFSEAIMDKPVSLFMHLRYCTGVD